MAPQSAAAGRLRRPLSAGVRRLVDGHSDERWNIHDRHHLEPGGWRREWGPRTAAEGPHWERRHDATFVTGHDRGEGSRVRWDTLAAASTVVFFMGMGNLPRIAARLIAAGRDRRRRSP